MQVVTAGGGGGARSVRQVFDMRAMDARRAREGHVTAIVDAPGRARLAAAAVTARAELAVAQCVAASERHRRQARLESIARVAGSAVVAAVAGALLYGLAMSGLARLDDPPAPASNFEIIEISSS